MNDFARATKLKEIFENLDRHNAEQYIAVRLLKGMGIRKKERDEIERAIWGHASTGVSDFERALHIFQFLLEKKCGFDCGTYDAGIEFGKVSEKIDIIPKLITISTASDQPIFLFAAPDSSKYCYVYFIISDKIFPKILNNFMKYKYLTWPKAWHPEENRVCIKQEVEIFSKQIEDPFQLLGITAAPGPIHASYVTY